MCMTSPCLTELCRTCILWFSLSIHLLILIDVVNLEAKSSHEVGNGDSIGILSQVPTIR